MICLNVNNTLMLRPNIYLSMDDPSPDLENQVQTALSTLEKNPIGKRLIEKIGNSFHNIYIKQGEKFSCYGKNGDCQILGKGCSSEITFPREDSNYKKYYTTQLSLASKPIFVDLAHELIHAYHNSSGKNAKNFFRCETLVWIKDEEYHTIMGFPSKKMDRTTPKITENAILSSLGLPERLGYINPSFITPVFYQRMKLVTKLYNQFCVKMRYEGQAKNPPPPIINCNYKDLLPSNRVMLVYSLNNENIVVLNYPEDDFSLQNFMKQEFNGDQCPIPWQLKNTLPLYANEQLISVGLYRLSLLEAHALDTSMGMKVEDVHKKIQKLEIEYFFKTESAE